MEKEITAVEEAIDIVRQNSTLRPRQIKFLSCFLACSTISEACEFAEIHRSTFYKWMNMPDFRAAMYSLQNRMLAEGLLNIKSGFAKAAANLASASLESVDMQKFVINVGLKILELELKYGKHKAPQGGGAVSEECLEPEENAEKEVLKLKEARKHWV